MTKKSKNSSSVCWCGVIMVIVSIIMVVLSYFFKGNGLNLTEFATVIIALATVFIAYIAWTAKRSWLEEVHTKAQLDALINLNKAFCNFIADASKPIGFLNYINVLFLSKGIKKTEDEHYNSVVEIIRKPDPYIELFTKDTDKLSKSVTKVIHAYNVGLAMDINQYENITGNIEKLKKWSQSLEEISDTLNRKGFDFKNPIIKNEIIRVIHLKNDFQCTLSKIKEEFFISYKTTFSSIFIPSKKQSK